MRYLRLIGLFAKVSVQNDAAYRADFAAHVAVTLLNFAAELVGLWTIFSNTGSLGGWNAWHMLALLGVFRGMYGIIGLFISPNMRRIMDDVRQGTLDFVLIKPVNAQFYASFRGLVVWRLADILLGAVLVAAACARLSAEVTVAGLALFVAMLACGVTIIYSFWLVLATGAFWLTRVTNMEMVFWNVFEAGRYPVEIYPPAVRWMLTYVVPLAFLTTFPAGSLIGKVEPFNVAAAAGFAALALAGASWFWRFGLRRYSGASA